MGRPKGSKNSGELEPLPVEIKTTTEAIETKDSPAEFVTREGGDAQTKRISFKVTPKGTIEFEGMRDATKKDLKSVIAATAKEADGAKNLGLKADDIPLIVPPEFCKQLYDALGKIESMIVQNAMKIDADIASGVFTYTKEEKDLLAMPTAVVLSKHSPLIFEKYKEEIQLAVILTGITVMKVNAVRKMQAERIESKKKPEGQQLQ